MKKASTTLLVLFPLLLGMAGCQGDDAQVATTPNPTDPADSPGQVDWLDELIAQLENEPVRNPPALIASYSYKGEIVYFVPSYCCDAMSVLYDSEGNPICSPDGGLTGKGDGDCPDFFELASDREVIWRDTRRR